MNDPRAMAASVVGAVDWESEVSGFCRCPGEAMHTMPSGKKDCRVSVDGAPTIFCFHASCSAVVAEANRRLRRLLAQGQWAIALPGGQVLRSGDILTPKGDVVTRAELARGTGASAGERVILESLRVLAGRFKRELFEHFRWPMARILEESPLLVSERDPEDQFRTWLGLWPPHCTLWIGDVYSSGKPEHRSNFRPIADWCRIGPAFGNFTCGSSFKAGSYRRTNENLNGHRFLVVESDTLSRDEVGR